MKFFTKIRKDEKGATAIEYGLIAALIAVAAISAMGVLGNTIDSTLNGTATEMSNGLNNSRGSTAAASTAS